MEWTRHDAPSPVRRMAFVGLGFMLIAAGTAFSRDVHVSPKGSPKGDGSAERPLDLATAISVGSTVRAGDTLYLWAGTYEGPMDGKRRLPFHFEISGSPEKPVQVLPREGHYVHVNGTVRLAGSHLRLVGLEIGDLLWDPTSRDHECTVAVECVRGVGLELVNCNIFGAAGGVLCRPGAGVKTYGCIIHDVGETRPNSARGHGHGYYVAGGRDARVLERSIIYRGYGWNVHLYGYNIGNVEMVENISYVAGALKAGQTIDNYLISSYTPAERIHLRGNVAYQPLDAQRWRPNVRLVSYRPVINRDAEVLDNYLMGAWYGLSLGMWAKAQVTGNTIWSTGVFMEINSSPTGTEISDWKLKPDLGGYRVERNTYIENGQGRPFIYASKSTVAEQDRLTFAEWQALGLDVDSRVVSGRKGRPAGTKVFVFKNAYEEGRAHVAIFNWDGLEKVDVDLAGAVPKGMKFKAYNCLDVRQTLASAVPVLEGVFEGKPTAFPMRRDAMSPDFDAFLVLPRR